MEKLFELQKQSGLSNRDIAALLNVTPSMIYRYKNGVVPTRLEVQARCTKAEKLLGKCLAQDIFPIEDAYQRQDVLRKVWSRAVPDYKPLQWR